MKAAILAFLLLPVGYAQTTAPPAQQGGQSGRTVLGVKPGESAIKNKDFYDTTGYFHPFRRMGRFVLEDQKAIWTSPFHTSKEDAKWWGIFGGLTGALIATDQYTAVEAPNTQRLVTLGDAASQLGAAYTLIPLSAGFYLAGTHFQVQRFREAGLLSFEALINATIVDTALKAVTQRSRPFEGNGEGLFWEHPGNPWNKSFPSGHAINTMAVASVFAHEYHDKWWVKVLAYSWAGAVEGARLAANKHFPGDVVAGGAMGWFIGDYVYAKRHNSEIAGKRRITQRILDHVHFGLSFQ